MKVNKNQAFLMIGGISAAVASKGAALAKTTTVHANATPKNTKVSNKQNKNRDTKGQDVTKIDSQSKMEIVTVADGDTTWDITRKHNTTVKQIVKDNDLANGGSLIHINDKLKIRVDDSTNKDKNKDKNNSTVLTKQRSQINNIQTSYSSLPTTNQTYTSTTTNQTQSQAMPPSTDYKSNVTGNEIASKEWIAARESGGSYTTRNASSGTYGRYQLMPEYLHGDYSPANQEKVANNYVLKRYGSWATAKSFWQAHNLAQRLTAKLGESPALEKKAACPLGE